MSILVDPNDLEAAANPYGPTAYVVVAGANGPRITHVRPRFDATTVSFRLGAGSAATAQANEALTLLWPATDTEPMSLIADCSVHEVTLGDEPLVVAQPQHVVRHRGAPEHPVE